jgi:quercetin dioxygenase-like cupin family protein
LKYSLEREVASIGRGMGIYHHVLCLGRNQGTYLEAVEEFWLDPCARAEPHFHDTHEFFDILDGSATVQIGLEARIRGPGDLIRIPRYAALTARAGKDGASRKIPTRSESCD